MTAKKAQTKKTTKKVQKEVKNPIELVSYSMEMTIPVGEYQNIKPRIEIKAESVEIAEEYILNWMQEWQNRFEKKPQVCPVVTVPEDEKEEVKPVKKEAPKVTEKSDTYEKGKKMIEATSNKESLRVILSKINTSDKVSDEERKELTEIVMNKLA